MDGVLWKSNDPIIDLPKILVHLMASGINYVFATNNATKSVEQYQNKFMSIFSLEIEPWRIITSAQASAEFLFNRYPQL